MALRSLSGLEDLKSRALTASKGTGVSVFQQMIDAIRLRFGETSLGFSEYYGYRIYDPTAVPPENIKTFGSMALTEQIWRGLNPPNWWVLASDKITFHAIMTTAGYPQPKLFAFMDMKGRVAPDTICLSDWKGVVSFLRQTTQYPMFGKSNGGYQSLGAMGLLGYNQDSDTLTLSNSETITTSQFVELASQQGPRRCDYLLQELIAPDPSIEDLTGIGLSTLRLVVLMGKNGPQIFRARWKIPTSGNMADNFWHEGNLLVELDPASGQVLLVMESSEQTYRVVDAQSKIGKRLYGSFAPQYQEALKTCLEASCLFSMFAFQSWDIALTDQGPMALEMNHDGDIEILQIGVKVGILDDQFKALLNERGLKLINRRRWLGGVFGKG